MIDACVVAVVPNETRCWQQQAVIIAEYHERVSIIDELVAKCLRVQSIQPFVVAVSIVSLSLAIELV